MAPKKRKRNNWLQRHKRDIFVRKARSHGYRSRAVYKLQEIDERDHLFHQGQVVLELGAAPGGWTQYAHGRVGPRGTVVAVDVIDMAPITGVIFIHGDITDLAVKKQIIDLLQGDGLADLVISDMAPNITGIRVVDQSRALTLVEQSLEVALNVLRPGGTLLVKLFAGGDIPDFRHRCALYFKQCVVRKPAASKERSREFYLLARGFIGDIRR